MFNIIVNPVGGSGASMRCWQKAEKLFQASGEPYQVYFSTREVGIQELCRQLTSDGKETDLIIVGGDGSLNEAVNGIEDFEHTRFAFLPVGSGNDLARSIQFHGTLEEMVAKILEKKVVRIADVGEVIFHNETDYIDYQTRTFDSTVYQRERIHRFNISAGIGFDAECCLEVELSKIKPFLNKLKLGKLSYIIAAIKIIFGHRSCNLTLTCNGITEQFDDCLLAVGMNHCYEGGGFRFCPQADPSDGILDCCIGNHLSSLAFFRIFPFAYSGSHVRFEGIHERKGREIRMQTDHPMWVHTDGEVACRSSDITIRLGKNQLKMLV